jgi:hypothetical protein
MGQVIWLKQSSHHATDGEPLGDAGEAVPDEEHKTFRSALADDEEPRTDVEWIASVLRDIETFAGMNGLPRLCGQVRLVRQDFLEEAGAIRSDLKSP